MTKLSFLLLGPLEIEQDGVPLSGLTTIKARALLVYLADRFRPCTRQALSGLLWSDVTEELARTSLRTALAQLRKAVGEYVLADRHRLWFNPGLPHWIDAHIFAHACNSVQAGKLSHPAVRRSLREAIYLYRGEFLSDLPETDAALFEEWVRDQHRVLSASGARCAAHARPGCTSALCPGRRHRARAVCWRWTHSAKTPTVRSWNSTRPRATRSRRCASMTNARASWRQN